MKKRPSFEEESLVAPSELVTKVDSFPKCGSVRARATHASNTHASNKHLMRVRDSFLIRRNKLIYHRVFKNHASFEVPSYCTAAAIYELN